MSTTLIRTALGALLLLAATPAWAQQPEDELPDTFKRLLRRGAIAAVFEPTYVSASAAQIRPEAWVLGVVIEGQPRAYSLSLLNRHEVVNDTIGKTPFAAVW
ncbi:MAG: DUF3179 domain-containing protein [Planctomycetes bacterium]|nr:DUF3179 domain-containing protein [Planctomycetota bacterium]